MLNIQRQLDNRQSRRMAAQDRYLARLEKREQAADRFIGELVREGRTVFYVYPAGGTYREGSHGDLVQFLIRNGYV